MVSNFGHPPIIGGKILVAGLEDPQNGFGVRWSGRDSRSGAVGNLVRRDDSEPGSLKNLTDLTDCRLVEDVGAGYQFSVSETTLRRNG